MAFFQVGGVYRETYRIESVVPFFQGELAIVHDGVGNQYYLQSIAIHRQVPLRAISQYRNLKLPQVIPYTDVFVERDMLVFIRPYVEIRALQEVIAIQELSEEQVVRWVRELLHVEAVLRSKPMSMYLLLDLRNIGVDHRQQLQVFYCGLEQIMDNESQLDWGTFIYSMLSGQFLDGPILKLPRNFKVSRAMARLIQKTLREYQVSPVLEQVEIFESKQTSGNILGKWWTQPPVIEKPSFVTANPIQEQMPSLDEKLDDIEEEGSAVKEDDRKKEEVTSNDTGIDPFDLATEMVWKEDPLELYDEESESAEDKQAEQTAKQPSATDKSSVKEESRSKTHPQQTTATISPVLAQLEGQDLSQSFVLKLNKQQEELEKEQEERLAKMRDEYKRREQALIEEHRRKLEAEQQRLLVEQRKKLEAEQQALLNKKKEELSKIEEAARLERERKKKEERRKARLAEARRQFEARQKQMMEREEKAFEQRQEELLAQLIAEYEQRKQQLLQQQAAEFERRTQEQLMALTAEWSQIEAQVDGEEEPIQATVAQSVTQVEQSTVTPVEEEEKAEIDDVFATLSLDVDEQSIAESDPITPVVEQSGETSEPVKAEEVFVVTEDQVIVEEEEEVSPPSLVVADETNEQCAPVAEVSVEQVEEPIVEVEAVIGKPEAVATVEEDDDTSEDDVEAVADGDGEPKKKKRRRRRRRRKKKAAGDETTDNAVDDSSTGNVDVTTNEATVTSEIISTSEATSPQDNLDEERRKRELELQQMEQELLELEKQETAKQPAKPKVDEPPMISLTPEKNNKPNNKPNIKPNNTLNKEPDDKSNDKLKADETNFQSPAVAKKVEVPVKDTTEHATLAKQFEQYLQLFKRKK